MTPPPNLRSCVVNADGVAQFLRSYSSSDQKQSSRVPRDSHILIQGLDLQLGLAAGHQNRCTSPQWPARAFAFTRSTRARGKVPNLATLRVCKALGQVCAALHSACWSCCFLQLRSLFSSPQGVGHEAGFPLRHRPQDRGDNKARRLPTLARPYDGPELGTALGTKQSRWRLPALFQSRRLLLLKMMHLPAECRRPKRAGRPRSGLRRVPVGSPGK
jgi:hypothetical protein